MEATHPNIHHGFYKAFSHEVTAAILVFQNIDKLAMLVSQIRIGHEAKCRNFVVTCQNKIYLHENEKSFSSQWRRTQPRFEIKAWATRKLPILGVELFSYVNPFFCSNTLA